MSSETHTQVSGRGVSAPPINIEGFNVSVTGPDAGAPGVVRIPVKDLLLARGFIEEFKTWMEELQEEWTEKVLQGINLDPKHFKRLKAFDVANILHIGRGKEARIYIQFLFMPKAVMHVPDVAKGMVYSWLWRNSLVIRNRPQCFYIISKSKVKELMKVKEEADAIIDQGNEILRRFRGENVEELKELLRKYNLPDDVNLNKYFHKIILLLTPVRISIHQVREWEKVDPEVAEALKNSVKEYVRRIAEEIINRLTPIIDSVIKERRINIKAAKERLSAVENILKDFNLLHHFNPILSDVRKAIENPIKYRMERNYGKVEDWAVDVRRLISIEW